MLDYYLTMGSPWAYLGHAALIDLGRRHGVPVRVRPTPISRLFSETGGVSLPQRHPARQRYRLVDLQRWCALRGVPLDPHAAHVRFDPALLDRVLLAMLASATEVDPFMRLAFRAIWVEGEDLADADVIARIARRAGLDGSPCLADAIGPAVQDLYEVNLRDAIGAGVFGAPSYVLNGEVFWGQDRIELLADALSSGRHPYRP